MPQSIQRGRPRRRPDRRVVDEHRVGVAISHEQWEKLQAIGEARGIPAGRVASNELASWIDLQDWPDTDSSQEAINLSAAS